MDNVPNDYIGRKVVEILKGEQLDDKAEPLESALEELFGEDSDQAIKAGKLIEQMCHPKLLGDLYIESAEKEWSVHLNSLRKSVNKKLKKLIKP